MKRSSRLICLFAFLFSVIPHASTQSHTGKMTTGTSDSQLQSYIERVAELSSRARANVYFVNTQSIFDGVQISFVNVGTGNLTFLRRDMVASGRIPLVLARVYDSGNTGSADFGPGWLLASAETIAVNDHIARLSSESGSIIEFVETNPGTFLLRQDRPSDYLQLTRSSPDVLRATLRTGISKEYKRIGALYHLATVTDRNGNQVHLTYSNGLLSKLDNVNHSVQFARNDKGRITAAQDDHGRKVQYVYDEKGLLIEVDDLGGNPWRYSYEEGGRLKQATDPLQRGNFSVEYDGSGKVRRLQLP